MALCKAKIACDICICLGAHGLAGTPVSVRGDEHLCAGVEDPVAERLSGETAENDRMDRAYSCACEHDDGELPDHRKINGNPVTLADAFFLQDVCKLGYHGEHLLVGEFHYIVFRFALEKDSNFVALAFFDLGIETVISDIGFAAYEPFHFALGKIFPVDLQPGFEPVKLFCNPAPKGFGILDRLFPHFFVFVAALYIRLIDKFL